MVKQKKTSRSCLRLSCTSGFSMQAAARVIKRGGLVAFPTDTLYGLAADPFNVDAVKRIFEVKGRAENKPILLLISDCSQLQYVVERVPTRAQALMDFFWPGPLTVVLPSHPKVPKILCGGGKTIGIRFPRHNVSLELIKNVGFPITATSANKSGEENPDSAEKVFSSIGNKIDLLLDGGVCSGLPSTVVAVKDEDIKILREGRISKEEILKS